VPNPQIFRSAGEALLALSASAILLVGLFLAYNIFQNPDGAGSAKNILAGPIKSSMGAAQVVNGQIQITGFKKYKNEQHAIVSTKTSFDADAYSYLNYELANRHAAQQYNLVWGRANYPGKLYTTPLHWNTGGASTVKLMDHPNWKGKIAGVGIHLTGEPRQAPTAITHLTLVPNNWQWALENIWSEWTAFRGWTPRSINYLFGTPRDSSLSPALAFTAWSMLAMLLLFLASIVTMRRIFGACIVVVAVPWIILDLLWQRELLTQLNETRYLFGNKTIAERHLADSDGPIYLYATRLKEEVLPSSTERIFLTHLSDMRNFERLKTHFYLLPHNIYNFGNQPPVSAARAGDYVLALGKQPGLRFEEQVGRLTWESGDSLPASLIDRDPQGVLYKIGPVASKPSGGAP